MLQESAELQEQVAELANCARTINEQDAEISLLATQTCQLLITLSPSHDARERPRIYQARIRQAIRSCGGASFD